MNTHAFNASSFSSLLVRVGRDVVVSDKTEFNVVTVEELDAIRSVFASWAITRPEAAVIAAVWAKEIAHENTYINEREFTSKEILNDVFGTEDTFAYLPVIRRLEALGFIAPTDSVYKQCSLEDRRKPMRGQIQLYLQYAVTVGFHMMMEAIRDGHADEEFFANSQSVKDTVRNLVYDAQGRIVRVSEITAIPHRSRKTIGRGMDNDLLTVVDVERDASGYVLNADTQRQIENVVTHVRGNRHDLLAEWGLTQTRRGNGTSILLYGPAGTGKTSGARMLARELGTTLFETSTDRIQSKWVGEGEKNLARMFAEYRKAVAREEVAPILLIDECEFLFGRRVDAGSSSDAGHNNLIGIVLKEMETLPGILVATTNLVENLDHAFSRRFDHKIHVGRPDKDAQRALWALYLKPTIPGASSVDVDALLRAGDFTGAVIARIVYAVCGIIAADDTREKLLRTEDLLAACYAEQRSGFDASTKGFIGFM
jgi:AAA+ superfamily predicted ATPase